ncbi:hypothetical protein LCGC14_3005900 [marine sediment metagenome]|uniref:Uncharacterized protein n=1 Tax=marine sediment metagenome TaxID=412755 RepID=A0A0F8ZQU1_9ZZZZ
MMSRWYHKYISEKGPQLPEVVNDVLPISKILVILGVVGFFLVMMFASISYGKSQSTPLPTVNPFSSLIRSDAMQLTRISAETRVPIDILFDLYEQNLIKVRTFDQQWSIQFATFHKAWLAGCWVAIDPPTTVIVEDKTYRCPSLNGEEDAYVQP